MKSINLTANAWHLKGWRPFAWKLTYSMELGFALAPDIAAIPAQVPGSAQAALKLAGLLPDWNVGLNSLQCEWVEHRHWEFSTEVQVADLRDGERITLKADGLDYSGWILVDGVEIGTFSGALLRHRFDLSTALRDGKKHQLSIIFDEPPAEQGQVGFTSQSHFFKPRFNYSWDWCPRFVPIGIWDRISLERATEQVEVIRASTRTDAARKSGELLVWVRSSTQALHAEVTISQQGLPVATQAFALSEGEQQLTLALKDLQLWWPNGHGEQPLYSVAIRVAAPRGDFSLPAFDVGFKEVRWLACEGAPTGALPWICEVNGKPIFLQGVNWTPIEVDYHSTPDEAYVHRIQLYQEMGCNTLRVWGGAFLEKEIFFRLCDEAGILVWQEFPLSSSGFDNWAPEDPTAIATLCTIATDYIRRRGHHASKLLWCGGNELQSAEGRNTGAGIPLDATHPCLKALADVVEREDPGTRFLPTSASGPRFLAEEKDFGKGLHHDVHGPWNMDGTLADWTRYWKNDDSLFRSETGMASASPVDLIAKYRDGFSAWPSTKDNPYWMHTGAWWLQGTRFQEACAGLSDHEAWLRYTELSLTLQADALAIAARACRDRFPRCGGFLVWMGHDAFPCAANTAIIDFAGRPKPAYHSLQGIFES